MRYVQADLVDDVVSSYDQTKTTIFGRCFSKTVDSKTALGPPLNQFIDVFSNAAIVPAPNATVCTSNGRVFSVAAEAAGVSAIALHTINFATGSVSYVGKIQISIPDTAATTTTFRSLKVLDSGSTGWKLFLTTTASVAINGGTFLVNKIDLADFVPVGFPTIGFASGNDQKAVYSLQDPANIGVGHLQTASAGSVLDASNNRLYVHNGVSATHQYYVHNTLTAPSYSTAAITGTAATDIISDAGHTFVDNDPIVFHSLTGGAGLTAGTVYFVRASVAGVSYQVSATTGGAVINFTTDISAGTVGRAFGTTGSNFVHKTGNLPALTGTLLLTDSEDFAQPTGTGFVTIDGFDCAFFATSSALYLGRLSELTSGAVSWPSLNTVNLLGTANQIIAPAATYATWSNQLNRSIYSTGQVFVIKQFVNNQIELIFGGASNRYFEGVMIEPVEFQPFSSITSLDVESGWIFITNGSTGQRGVMACDLRSHSTYDYSYFITKVLNTPDAVLSFLASTDALFEYTGSFDVYYRTSGFGSATGGWVSIPFAEDISAFASGAQVQFKVLFSTLGLDTSIHAQVTDFFLGFESLTDNSLNWELSVDDSDNGNPSRTAFRLKTVYSSSVPTLYYRAFDLSNVLLVNHNSVTNAALFEYSTDSGVSWNALGVVPNTIGTLVRYTFSAPPGVDIRPSLRES